jgi:hypothetical protein
MVDQEDSFSSCSLVSSVPCESEAIKHRPSDFLSQCVRAFNQWFSLKNEHKKGNVVVIPALDDEKGVVHIATTDVTLQDGSTVEENVYLGVTGTQFDLVHGSVVAIYCDASQRFLQMVGRRVNPKEGASSEKLSRDALSHLFLVVDLGHDCFAFYGIKAGRFLGISSGFEVYGLWSAADLKKDPLDDEDVVEAIPDDALFIARSERSDGSLVSFLSLFQKRFLGIENGSIHASTTTVGPCETFRIVVVMDSSRLGGLDEQCAWVPASGLARKFTIQHCFNAFSQWKAGLATFPNRLDGNLVGVLKQDPSTGEISISDTEIVQSQRLSSARLGIPGRVDSLSHCNVVALRSRKIDRFMRTQLGSVAGSVNAPQITPTSRNRPYLVLTIAENEFAFYNVYWNSFLVVESPDSVIPFQPKMHLGREAVSDEHILSRIPEGAVFIVKSEGSDGSAISLYSKKFHTFVTMTDDGKVNASATSPGDSELFRIVLLMKVDLFAE